MPKTAKSKKNAAGRPSGTPRKKAAGKAGAAPAGSEGPVSEKRRRAGPRFRGVKAFVCLMLAFFSLIGCFTSEGWFISFFRVFLQGLIGKGYFITPVALGFCALLLVMFKDRPVKSRLACALLLTVILGAFIHLFTCTTEFNWSWRLPGELYRSGTISGAAGSGGLIGGLLALSFETRLTRPVETIFLVLAFVILLLAAFDITFVTVAEWYRGRAAYEPDAEAEDDYILGGKTAGLFGGKAGGAAPQASGDRLPGHPAAARTGGKVNIDIPVDEPPRLGGSKKEAASFFNPTPGVELPDKKKLADIFIKDRAPAQPSPASPHAGPNAADYREAKPSAPAATPEEIAEFELKNRAAKAAEAVEMKKAADEVMHNIEKSLTASEPIKYAYPPLDLLAAGSAANMADGREEMVINAKRLSATIKSFGIPAEIINITRGPSVTRYEVELEQGVKLNKLTNLADDIALALGASGVRIAPIPNKISIVGIGMPNKLTHIVNLRDVIASDDC